MTQTADEMAARLRDTVETYADGVFLANRLAVLAVLNNRDAKAAEIEALTARVGELERALEGIEVVAQRHEKGAIGVAQKIARAALNRKKARGLEDCASTLLPLPE